MDKSLDSWGVILAASLIGGLYLAFSYIYTTPADGRRSWRCWANQRHRYRDSWAASWRWHSLSYQQPRRFVRLSVRLRMWRPPPFVLWWAPPNFWNRYVSSTTYFVASTMITGEDTVGQCGRYKNHSDITSTNAVDLRALYLIPYRLLRYHRILGCLYVAIFLFSSINLYNHAAEDVRSAGIQDGTYMNGIVLPRPFHESIETREPKSRSMTTNLITGGIIVAAFWVFLPTIIFACFRVPVLTGAYGKVALHRWPWVVHAGSGHSASTITMAAAIARRAVLGTPRERPQVVEVLEARQGAFAKRALIELIRLEKAQHSHHRANHFWTWVRIIALYGAPLWSTYLLLVLCVLFYAVLGQGAFIPSKGILVALVVLWTIHAAAFILLELRSLPKDITLSPNENRLLPEPFALTEQRRKEANWLVEEALGKWTVATGGFAVAGLTGLLLSSLGAL